MRCDICGDPLPPRRTRWCSEACRYRWRVTVPVVPFDCHGCGSTVLVPEHKYESRKYCSLQCSRATYNRLYRTGARNGRWRGGRALSYGPRWKAIKQQVRARDRVCRACGKTPEQNGRALDVHHVDPYRFSGDNALENLKALCRSCHMRADDHGRAGSADFLRKNGRPTRPTKRQIRRLRALTRNAERTARRRARQSEAVALAAAGASLRLIARALGVSHQTVANWLIGRYQVESD